MITGETILIAHFGYPTKTFKAPMIYNPYFDKIGVNAVVMPMGVKAENYAEVLKAAVQAHQHTRRARDHAAQGHDGRARGRSLDDRANRRRVQRDPAPARRYAGRRHVRRRGFRSRRRAQGPAHGRGERAGRRLWRRRLGDRRFARGGGGRAARPVRRLSRFGRGAGIAAESALSQARGCDRLQRSERLRNRRQRHPARHERRRPAADGRRAAVARRHSSAKS